MLNSKTIFLVLFLSFSIASVYDEGDFISITHQNITKTTCYAGNEYGVGDLWKLLDWNGAENGGHYNVMFIDMAASW